MPARAGAERRPQAGCTGGAGALILEVNPAIQVSQMPVMCDNRMPPEAWPHSANLPRGATDRGHWCVLYGGPRRSYAGIDR
jgi:hypothetical protein